MSDPRRVFAAAALLSAERWTMPQMHGPVVGRVREDKRPPAGPDPTVLARQEAERLGYEAGLARAQAEMQPRSAALDACLQQFEAVMQLLSGPLAALDAQMEEELTQLALTVGKQLARRELRIDPSQVIAIIRQSLGQLPAAAREVRVHLHPEDAATVRQRLPAPASDRAWTLVEDPTLSRGGCLVRSETSQIDARLESRIQAVMHSALGDERLRERPSAETATTAPTGDRP